MRKQLIPGWAVVFATTILLAACATHDAQVTHYYKMAGADAAVAQMEKQPMSFDEDGAIFVSPDWLDVRESLIEEKETELNRLENSLAINQAWLNEREMQLGKQATQFDEGYVGAVSPDWLDVRESLIEEKESSLNRRENYLVINEAWLNERETRLNRMDDELDRRENYLAINQAWLTEREMQLSLNVPDLTRQDDLLAFEKTWMDEGALQTAQQEDRSAGAEHVAGFSSLPTNAEPGRCYAQVIVPGEQLTVTDKVLIKDAGTKVEIVPARYETVSEQVLVEKGSLQLKVTPPEYSYVTERVMVEPAKTRLVHVPAQYELVNEQVMVKPATTTWKHGTGPIQRVDDTTGEILCLVETPAQYQTVSKSVMKTPASTREIVDPPVYKTIERRVMTKPAKTEMVDTPATYKTVQVTKLIEPAHEISIPVPAQFQTVTKKVRVSEDRMDWQEVICETNLSPDKVTNIQLALDWFGFSPGPIDGVLGDQTMAAVNEFQKDHGLTVAKYLTIDTVRALGVIH